MGPGSAARLEFGLPLPLPHPAHLTMVGKHLVSQCPCPGLAPEQLVLHRKDGAAGLVERSTSPCPQDCGPAQAKAGAAGGLWLDGPEAGFLPDESQPLSGSTWLLGGQGWPLGRFPSPTPASALSTLIPVLRICLKEGLAAPGSSSPILLSFPHFV